MNDEDLLRYNRQIMLPEIDVSGQEVLLGSSVLIIGLGGLGCPVAMYLAAAGVGRLILADHDVVDLSNLQRQIAHGTNNIGQMKVASAAEAVRLLNPHTKVDKLPVKLSGKALTEAVEQADLVVDASDNFATRFAVNTACVQAGKPLVSGAATRYEGQITAFDSRRGDSPCYRCLYDDQADDITLSCSESGVLSPVVGVIGSLQALEVIKILVGVGESLVGFLLLYDAKYGEWRRLKLPKQPDCPACAGC